MVLWETLPTSWHAVAAMVIVPDPSTLDGIDIDTDLD